MNNRSHELLRERRERISASREERIKNLYEKINVGVLYQSLLNTPGWKHLCESYLNEALSPERLLNYLYVEEGRMKEEMIKMQAFWDLMGFVQGCILDGNKATIELQKLEKKSS